LQRIRKQLVGVGVGAGCCVGAAVGTPVPGSTAGVAEGVGVGLGDGVAVGTGVLNCCEKPNTGELGLGDGAGVVAAGAKRLGGSVAGVPWRTSAPISPSARMPAPPKAIPA
jgi:hypothetical protein